MPDTTKQDQSFQVATHQERCLKHNPSALARLFEEWMHGDEAEQRETFETLRSFLDENRPDGYKLFS